jgi:uncharacterized caspase-like protein
MAKVALLIGVSEYENGLNPLPGAVKDVEAMQRVLAHPEMGGFAPEKRKGTVLACVNFYYKYIKVSLSQLINSYRLYRFSIKVLLIPIATFTEDKEICSLIKRNWYAQLF